MKGAIRARMFRAGAVIRHDQQEMMMIPYGAAEEFMGQLERETLYRFFNASAAARAQALHLTSNRAGFILRTYVDRSLFEACATLDEVEAAIERRKADQSERVVRLRELAGGEAQQRMMDYTPGARGYDQI